MCRQAARVDQVPVVPKEVQLLANWHYVVHLAVVYWSVSELAVRVLLLGWGGLEAPPLQESKALNSERIGDPTEALYH